MRVLHNIGDSFLDFVEENQYGSWIFKAARLALFAMVLMAGGKVASGQFLSFQWDEVLFIGCGVIGAILIAWRWELAIIVVLGTTAFIFHYRAIPTLSLYHFIPELKWLEDFRLFLGQGDHSLCLGSVLSESTCFLVPRPYQHAADHCHPHLFDCRNRSGCHWCRIQ